jgi:hypothetical protein
MPLTDVSLRVPADRGAEALPREGPVEWTFEVAVVNDGGVTSWLVAGLPMRVSSVGSCVAAGRQHPSRWLRIAAITTGMSG